MLIFVSYNPLFVLAYTVLSQHFAPSLAFILKYVQQLPVSFLPLIRMPKKEVKSSALLFEQNT